MFQRDKISLTQLTEADIPRIAEWRNSIELKRLTGHNPFIPVNQADIKITNSSTTMQFAIRANDPDKLIGCVGLSNIVWSNRTADLGIFIGDVSNRGKGFGAAAISAMLDYAFAELNLYRVQLDVVDYNERAIKTYRDLGFTQEGARRQHGERDGKRYDVLLFGILAYEWSVASKA